MDDVDGPGPSSAPWKVEVASIRLASLSVPESTGGRCLLRSGAELEVFPGSGLQLAYPSGECRSDFFEVLHVRPLHLNESTSPERSMIPERRQSVRIMIPMCPRRFCPKRGSSFGGGLRLVFDCPVLHSSEGSFLTCFPARQLCAQFMEQQDLQGVHFLSRLRLPCSNCCPAVGCYLAFP